MYHSKSLKTKLHKREITANYVKRQQHELSIMHFKVVREGYQLKCDDIKVKENFCMPSWICIKVLYTTDSSHPCQEGQLFSSSVHEVVFTHVRTAVAQSRSFASICSSLWNRLPLLSTPPSSLINFKTTRD